MASSADVMVRFLADTSQVDKGVSSMGSTLKSFGRGLTTFIGGAALGSFARDAVDAANNMAESVNKVNVVFGKGAGAIRKFTDSAAQNLGLSRQAALDAAGAYGNMFTQLGLTTDQAVSMSKGMLTLTADIASFHNADPTAVLEAQQAAFRGEYDALQKFIPTITAAAVEQRALADTGKTSASQLTASEKAAATYALMMEGAGKATGDFARTSDSAANQQRIMKAKMDDATVSLGQALAPAVAAIVPLISKLADGFASLAGPLQDATVSLIAFGAIALAVGGTVGLIVAAIGLVVTAAVLLWTNWDQVWNWIKDHPAYAIIIGILAAPIAAFVLIIGGLKWLSDNWSAIWDTIKRVASDAWNWIKQAWDDGVAFIKGIPDRIASALSTIWNVITAPFRSAIDEVKRIFGEIGGAFDGAISGVKGAWNAFARGWNSVDVQIPSVSLPFGIGEVGGGEFRLPHLPILASGGIVNSPTLALLGEAGREAVVPLPASGLGTTNVYSIEINVAPGVSPSVVGATVVDQIRAYERVAGRAWRAG